MKVKLDSVKRDGGNTADDKGRIGKEFRVRNAIVGATGVFSFVEDEDKALFTSKVESVGIYDCFLNVKTRNTEYYFIII